MFRLSLIILSVCDKLSMPQKTQSALLSKIGIDWTKNNLMKNNDPIVVVSTSILGLQNETTGNDYSATASSISTVFSTTIAKTTSTKCIYTMNCPIQSYCLSGMCVAYTTLTINDDNNNLSKVTVIDPLIWVLIITVPFILIAIILFTIVIYCKKSCKLITLFRRRNRRIVRQIEENQTNSGTGRDSSLSSVQSENRHQEDSPPPLYNEVSVHRQMDSSTNDSISIIFKLPSYSSFIKKNPVEIVD